LFKNLEPKQIHPPSTSLGGPSLTSRPDDYKEAAQVPLRTPKRDRKVTYHTNRYVKYNEFVRSAIRREVNSFIFTAYSSYIECGVEKGK
jgi:hypothetical protein